MPLDLDPLPEIVDRIHGDLNARMAPFEAFIDARLDSSPLNAIGKTWGGDSFLFYGRLGWLARQAFPDTAEGESLERWASFWGKQRQGAQFASGEIDFAGPNGTAIGVGRALQYADGTRLSATTGGTIAGGVLTLEAVADEAGEGGNAVGGTVVELVNPIAGVTAEVSSSEAMTGGFDAEDDEQLLVRLLQRTRTIPGGGNAEDYVGYLLDAEDIDVDRVWVYPLELGAGTVVIRFTVNTGSTAPIPDAGQVSDAQAVIDALRPVTAAVTVVAPTTKAFDLDATIVPDTSEAQGQAEDELESLFAREGEPGGTIPNSHLRDAISAAALEESHTLDDVDGDGTGLSDVTTAAGELPILGVVTWL